MPFTAQCSACAVLIFLTAGLVEATGSDSSVSEVSRSNQDFATALYSELAKEDNSSNIFFSPLGIQANLALAYVGSGGQTAQYMAAGLRLPDNVDVVKTGFQQLLQGLNNDTSNVALEIVNKIYMAKGSSVNDEFNKAATENFFSEVQNVDLSLKTETARLVYEWVNNKTLMNINKIKTNICEDDLDDLTEFVLVNAVYFKGKWKSVFDKEKTKLEQFHVTTDTTKDVEMMCKEATFALVTNNDIGADILELNYKGDTMSLVIILPFDVDGLSKLENKLRGTNLTTIFESLRVYQTVEVKLPKFKLEHFLKLNDYLMALGMTTMFQEDTADFSPMSNSGSSVTKVFHKVIIEVDEEGTEAAAATQYGFTHKSMTEVSLFHANHPFVFILRCKISGAVIFMGRFADPD